MKMKKAIAGLVAGIVAVSAMAMTVSAKEVTQAAKETTFSLKDNQWVASWKTDVTGKVGTTPATAGDPWYADPAATETVILDIAAAGGTALDFAKVELADIKLAVKGTDINNDNRYVTQTIELKKVTDGEYSFLVVPSTSSSSTTANRVLLSKFDSAYPLDVTLTYTLKTKTKFATETKAKDGDVAYNDLDKNKDSVVELDVADASGALTGVADDFVTALVGTWESVKATFANDGAEGFDLTGDQTYELDTIKTNLTYGLASAVAGTKGSELVFTFAAPDADEEDNSISGPSIKLSESIEDFGLMINNTGKLQKSANVVDNTATFKWDDVVASSGLSINAIGLVNSIKILSNDDITLESITVKTPAKTFDDLSAGESSSDSAAEVTTAAPATEATTTAAATNPGTGNAPIALAVIPVAIAAAAIIAKKRG